MSEHQFVHFLAVDRPVSEAELKFMRQQSTRAEITPWEFTNEYHYGDFHGNALEMLRRGYDVHLHYANFGIRKLMFRLPAGLPCDRKTFAKFCPEYGIAWHADKRGRGGILVIEPEADGGSYDEDLFDVDELLPQIVPLRNDLIGGDLRALYVAWLACAGDDEALEPPVPAGLGKPSAALKAMAKFYAFGSDWLRAAADRSPPLPDTLDASEVLEAWIGRQSPDELRVLVRRLLGDDTAAARAETLARVRDESGSSSWPLGEPARTWAEIRQATVEVENQRLKREERARQAAYRKRLQAIAADPDKLIAEVRNLVTMQSSDSYAEAAQRLVELREALGPEQGPIRARAVAEELRRNYPTRRTLIGALKKQKLLG